MDGATEALRWAMTETFNNLFPSIHQLPESAKLPRQPRQINSNRKSMATSALQIETNRANARHSTGPRTPDGKQRSSLNAVRHGLTGQMIVMPHEDMQVYLTHCDSFVAEWKPTGVTETHLVQSIADIQWRLHRAHAHQLNIDDVDDRAMDRITRYTSRIQRDLQSSIKLLLSLQTQRKAHEQKDLEEAAMLHKFFEMKQEPWYPSEFGFVLTTTEIERHVRRSSYLERAKAHGG